jgi:hypothetical protein
MGLILKMIPCLAEKLKKAIPTVAAFVFQIFCLNLILSYCSSPELELEYKIDIHPRLEQDENGFFHLDINRETWQTIHRLSGQVTLDGEPAENVRVEWASSHFWTLNDTLGYYVQYGYTDQLEYIAVDTTYVTGFNDFIVPVINCCSYSNADGEINTMIAPVKSMIGDTMTIVVQFNDNEPKSTFEIVLD